MNEEAKKQREDLLKAKFAEVQKILFTASLSVGEISNIINALNQSVAGLTINMPVPEPEPTQAEEVKVDESKDAV